jgi:hypothetical protein
LLFPCEELVRNDVTRLRSGIVGSAWFCKAVLSEHLSKPRDRQQALSAEPTEQDRAHEHE